MPFSFLESSFSLLCPICSSPRVLKIGICDSCRRSLINEMVPTGLNFPLNHRLQVYPLFLWGESSTMRLRRLIYLLKGGGFGSIQGWLAREFYFRHRLHKFITRPTLLVPAPPQFEGYCDHAYAWSHALSQVLKASAVYQPLKRISHQSQRNQSLNDRKSTAHHAIKRSISGMPGGPKYIFCDDIVTTGSTAQAALAALKVTKESLPTFCIAYRKKAL